MLNSVNPVDSINNINSTLSFKKKGVNRQELYKFMDTMNESAIEHLNRTRSIEEQREFSRTKSVNRLSNFIEYVNNKYAKLLQMFS